MLQTTENTISPAIRPYPVQYVQQWSTDSSITIRPVRPEDEPLMVLFHQELSEESVYLRYAHMVNLKHRIAHERLTRSCFIDYDREMLLVADRKDPETSEHQILGVARLSNLHGKNAAEFALIVRDSYQERGLGTELLRLLLQIGREEKLNAIVGYILTSNYKMQSLCEKIGVELKPERGEGMLKAVFVY